jgi:hypothetical protein
MKLPATSQAFPILMGTSLRSPSVQGVNSLLAGPTQRDVNVTSDY